MKIEGACHPVISVCPFNTYNAESVSRRQVQNFTKCLKNVIIFEFHDHIWNHQEKCIQESTNMPGIVSLILEIDIKNLRNLRKQTLQTYAQ